MRKDIALILLILAILALIVVPLGPVMLDALLSINLTLSVLLLIVAVYLRHPADFPTFPTVILLGTAFRLALSISTTRQILSEAEAGDIIETFGTFVIGGNIVIGLIVFLIITVFQFLVITKGAERVAEVSARFALDALPGKQMSIDADLRAEAIDKETAQQKREDLAQESQFFGAMDGAMKFVKGDAIAGLIIIFINLVGGISVGMLVLGFSFDQAVHTYTLLTLGDGLVAQLPALLMALCAGIVTTRVEGNDNTDLGTDIWRDLVNDPRVPAAAAGIVVLIGLIPGFPFINFAIGAVVLLAVSLSMRKMAQMLDTQDDEPEVELVEVPEVVEEAADVKIDDRWAMNAGHRSDRVKIRIGEALVQELDVEVIDRTLASYLARYDQSRGILLQMPTFEIIKDQPRHTRAFEIVLDEVPLVQDNVPEASFLLYADQAFAEAFGATQDDLTPVRWHELTGFWVPETFRKSVDETGVEATEIGMHIATVAFRTIETNVGSLFGLEHLDRFYEHLEKVSPAEKARFEGQADRTVFFQTLRYLAEDGVPLRPVSLIIDTFLSWLQLHPNAGALRLSEFMRGNLNRQICHAMAGEDRALGVVLLDPDLEKQAQDMIAQTNGTDTVASTDGLPLGLEVSDNLLTQFKAVMRTMTSDGPTPVVIASSSIRRRLRNFLSANRISFPVLAPHEISPEIQIHPIARMKLDLPM